MLSMTEAVLRHIAVGEHVQVATGGGHVAGEVRDLNDHFIVLCQKDSLHVLFWHSVDAIRKTLKSKMASEE